MTLRLKSLIIFGLLCTNLLSNEPDQRIHYEVSYMGIPLLDMTLTWIEDDSSVFVSYDNQLKPFIAYFHPVHNIYNVHFMKDSFAPLEWSKSVSEGDMQFQFNARRSLTENKVIIENGDTDDFPAGGFTVFSATHFLAAKAFDTAYFPVTLPIYIDGQLWEATVDRFDNINPHPNHALKTGEVLIQTDLHYVSGETFFEKNDILTSVIATEGTQFLLWVTPGGTYTKAQFGKFPKAVILRQAKD